MSQVQKFQQGGKPKRIIKYGTKELNLDTLLQDFDSNINVFDEYLDQIKAKESEKQEALNAYRDIIKGYDAGEITPQLGNMFHDSTGNRHNVDKKFDPYGVAQNFIHKILSKSKEIVKPEKFDKSKSWKTFLSKQNLDYNLFKEMTDQEQNEFLGGLLQEYVNGLNGDDYSDFDPNYGQSILDYWNTANADKTLSAKERMELSRLGINLSNFYATKKSEETEKKSEESTPQSEYQAAVQEAQTIQLQEATDKLRKRNEYLQLPDRGLSINFSTYSYTPYTNSEVSNKFKSQIDSWKQKAAVEFENFLRTHDVYKYNSDFWNKKATHKNFGISSNLTFKSNGKVLGSLINSEWTNGQLFRFLLDNYKEQQSNVNVGGMPISSDGHIIMGYGNGYGRLYDPVRSIFYDKPASKIYGTVDGQTISLLDLDPQFAVYQPATSEETESNKEGGVLKAQFGAALSSNYVSVDEINRRNAEAKRIQQEEELQKAVTNSGKTEEQYKASQRKLSEGLQDQDIARLVGLGTDLVALGASYAPVYGTAVSAAAGILGIGADLTADMLDESLSGWDVAKNAGINLGLSALALIPGLGSVKIAAKAKKMMKLIPHAISTLAGLGIVFDDDVHKSISKILNNPKDFNNDDMRNIALFSKALMGLNATAVNTYKGQKFNSLKPTEKANGKYNVNGKQLTEKEIETINKVGKEKGNDEALAKFREITGDSNAELPSNVDFKQKGLFKGARSTEVSGDPIMEPGMLSQKDNIRLAVQRARSMKFKRDNPQLSKYLNTDYNIFYKGERALLPGINLGFPDWTPTGKIVNKKLAKQQAIQNARIAAQQQRVSNRAAAKSRRNPDDIRARWTARKENNYNLTQRQVANAAQAARPNVSNITGVSDLSRGVTRINSSGLPVTEVINPSGQKIKFVDLRSKFKTNPQGRHHPINRDEKDRLYRILNKSTEGDWKKNIVNTENLNFLIPEAKVGVINKRGDTVYWWKQGSKIPKLANGSTVTNTTSHDGYSWYDIIYNTDFFKDTLKSINKENYQSANDLQNRFYTDKINTGWQNQRVGYNDKVKSYQTEFNNRYGTWLNTGAIEAGIKKGLIKRQGITGDNTRGSYSDGYSGAMTNLRHLGLKEHEQYIPAMNEILKEQGLEAFVNPETNMINYRPLTDPNSPVNPNPQVNPQTDPQTDPQQDPNNPPLGPGSDVLGKDIPIPDPEQPDARLPQRIARALGAGRLIGTLRTNHLIKNALEKGIRPNLIDTYRLQYNTRDKENIKQDYNKQASEYENLSFNKNLTSDSRNQYNRELQAIDRAIKKKAEGTLISDAEIARTNEIDQKTQNENIARESEKSNKNSLAINDYIQTLARLRADHKLKNWNAISTYLLEQQDAWNKDYSDYRTLLNNWNDAKAEQDYKLAMKPYEDAVYDYMLKNPNENLTDSAVYEDYINKARSEGIKLLNAKYQFGFNNVGLFGRKYSPFIIPATSQIVTSS